MSTIQVGPSNGDPEGYRINLSVFTNQNLQPDEKQHTIDQARPIIERSLQSRGYPSSALSTFTYFVMYENSDRNMSLVGKSLESVRPQLRTLLPPVMSTYHLGPFSGEPDDFCIYLSVNCKDEFRETEKAELVERAKTLIERELRMNGYSIDAIKSFSYEIVHQEDIDKAGGWYSFLR